MDVPVDCLRQRRANGSQPRRRRQRQPRSVARGVAPLVEPLAVRVAPFAAFAFFAAFAPCAAFAASAQSPARAGIERTYYIAADEVRWNYAPRGRHLTGAPIAEPDEAIATPTQFLKAIYREYTDGAFKTLKPRPSEWEHLGILGPLIRAEVGDTITVVFRNQTNTFAGMHPHGLAYDKASEGALYNDGTSGVDKADDRIAPGGSHTYRWRVPPRAGPGPGEGSSVLWMYHSHFVEP